MKGIPSGKTREVLTHFICSKCKKWWSISDAPIKRTTWHCPWCGKKGLFLDKTMAKKK